MFNRLFLEPLYNSKYPTELFDELKERGEIVDDDLNFLKEGDLDIISRDTDFLGVNYYSRGVVRDEEVSQEKIYLRT